MLTRRNSRKRQVFKTLPVIMAVLLSSCGGNDLSDLKNYVATTKARQKGAVEPLPEVKTIEPFIFKAEDLHDPFLQSEKAEPAEEAKGINGIRPDTARPREELESYELDSLRMVGTLSQNNVLWGLVKATDGTIHRIRTGNYMGRNFGKIIRIREGQIELLEIIPDGLGGWRERKAAVDLTEGASGKR